MKCSRQQKSLIEYVFVLNPCVFGIGLLQYLQNLVGAFNKRRLTVFGLLLFFFAHEEVAFKFVIVDVLYINVFNRSSKVIKT